MNYTKEQIDCELRHYPTTPGINRAGDIMRQLTAQLSSLAVQLEEAKKENVRLYETLVDLSEETDLRNIRGTIQRALNL